VDVLVLVVTAEERYRLSAGSSDSQTANGDELGLLQTDGIVSRAGARRAPHYYLTRLFGRIGLDDDAVDFGSARKIVFARDRKLFGIGAGLDSDGTAGTGGVKRGLYRRKARGMARASGISSVDVKRGRLLCGNRNRRENDPHK